MENAGVSRMERQTEIILSFYQKFLVSRRVVVYGFLYVNAPAFSTPAFSAPLSTE